MHRGCGLTASCRCWIVVRVPLRVDGIGALPYPSTGRLTLVSRDPAASCLHSSGKSQGVLPARVHVSVNLIQPGYGLAVGRVGQLAVNLIKSPISRLSEEMVCLISTGSVARTAGVLRDRYKTGL